MVVIKRGGATPELSQESYWGHSKRTSVREYPTSARTRVRERRSLGCRRETSLKDAGPRSGMPEPVASPLVRWGRLSIGLLMIGCGEAWLAGECCSCCPRCPGNLPLEKPLNESPVPEPALGTRSLAALAHRHLVASGARRVTDFFLGLCSWHSETFRDGGSPVFRSEICTVS
jgi:hypothetical protein